MNQKVFAARLARSASAIFLIFFAWHVSARAQVATGGTFALEQSVIAGGGGQNSTGGTFSLDGTVGQAAAGTRSSNSPFIVTGGFWNAPAFNPTAALVSIEGRVLTDTGRGIRNVRLTLTEADGTTRTALSTAFGYYRFADVQAGQTVILAASGKRFTFVEPVRAINLLEDAANANFIAVP